MKWIRKLLMRAYLSSRPKDSIIYCDPKGDFYAVYYSDLKRWVIKNGDYCKLKK